MTQLDPSFIKNSRIVTISFKIHTYNQLPHSRTKTFTFRRKFLEEKIILPNALSHFAV
jgi:hypothetical protein